MRVLAYTCIYTHTSILIYTHVRVHARILMQGMQVFTYACADAKETYVYGKTDL